MKTANKAILLAFCLIVGLAGGAVWLDRASQDHTSGAESPVDAAERPAISFGALQAMQFRDVSGAPVTLARWQGKTLIVNFWATWCAPCKEEMPMLSQFQMANATKNIQVVGIAADSAANVQKFASSEKIAYPLLPDESGAIQLSKRLGNRLGLLPHTVVFSPEGQIVFAKLGKVTEQELSRFVSK